MASGLLVHLIPGLPFLAALLVVLGAAKLLGSDGILAVFVAGLGFDFAVKSEPEEERENTEANGVV